MEGIRKPLEITMPEAVLPISNDAAAEELAEQHQQEQKDPALEGAAEGDLTINALSERIVIDKADTSLFEFDRRFREGRLIIDPEWQRSYVWDLKRASRLIESFLLDIPVPVVYLAVNDEGNYEVIDGVQRLTSIFKFFGGEIALSGLEMLPNLNKKKFKDLEPKLQNKLKDTTLRCFSLTSHTSSNFLFIIFERLNTGGVPLNEMEVRNCVYRGSLNNLIKDLATYPEFVNSINQKDLPKRMGDRALVLRFLAFYERHYTKASQGLKQFLNEFFDTYRNAPADKLAEYEKKFKSAMRAAFTVFGDKAFRLRRVDAKGGGEWAPRINAPIFQVLSVSFTEYDLTAITERADSILEEYLDLTASDLKFIDAVTKATGDTTAIRYSFETWNSRLTAVMAGAKAKDTQRLFSKKLKQEMFEQDHTCHLCGNQIAIINDAALDHDVHYWRGGKTVPSNARLVHRQCNLKRIGNVPGQVVPSA